MSKTIERPNAPREQLQRDWEVTKQVDSDSLTQLSNSLAAETYAPHFQRICDSKMLVDFDLESIDLGIEIPVLRNGANKYLEASSRPAIFKTRSFEQQGLTPDCHVIIPEVANLASNYLTNWDPTVAMRSLQPALAQLGEFYFAELGDMSLSSALRYYDSHLSVGFYWRTCDDLVEKYGFRPMSGPLRCSFRQYKCDLGSRFCDDSVDSLFVSNTFFCSEHSTDVESGKGKCRTFVNDRAPNAKHLLLVGDSHSFSAMSHIFSHYFQKVTFYWANRVNNYGSSRDEIASMAQEADFFIEETSERFLLRNFTVT